MRSVVTLLSLVSALVADIALAEDMSSAIQSACGSNQCWVTDLQREDVAPGIGHYSATLRVGPGEHEVIGIHRVVQENSPWNPKAMPKSIFLSHGDTLNFNVAFLIGPDGGSKTSSISGVLAANNIDVWGIDQRWAKVPLGTIDPAIPESDDFMTDWDLDVQVRDTRIALLVARGVRALTGSGFGKIAYLGWSRGGQTGYVLTGLESQLSVYHPARSVNGLAILDVPLKSSDPTFVNTVCDYADASEDRMASGIYADPIGATIQLAGNLAATDPNGASPLVPGLTNYQAILLLGGATHALGLAYNPNYHLVGANFNEFGIPTDLLFTDPDVFIQVAQNVSPYEALGVMRDGDRVVCTDTEHDDHLGSITIPVLYVGANGGLGPEGNYTLTLLGSYPANVEAINIEITGNRFTDFGHDDVVRSPLANDLWWEALIDWVYGL